MKAYIDNTPMGALLQLKMINGTSYVGRVKHNPTQASRAVIIDIGAKPNEPEYTAHIFAVNPDHIIEVRILK